MIVAIQYEDWVINNLDVDDRSFDCERFDSKCPYWDIESFECIHTCHFNYVCIISNKINYNNNNKYVIMDDIIIIVMFILY